jgi:hypothetical protein
MKRLAHIFLWVSGGLFAVVLVVLAQEIFIFVGSTETSAREQAKGDFLHECARDRLDPNEFTGPQRVKSPERTYGYVWRNPSKGMQILTLVRYFPAGVESWQLQGDHHYAPYCDGNTPACQ